MGVRGFGEPHQPMMGPMSRLKLAAAAAATLLVALLVSDIARAALLPRELQYVPPENGLVVLGGRIDELWRAVDEHFGLTIRDRSRESFLFEGLRRLADDYGKKGSPVDSLDALRARGIDTSRGFVYSIYRETDSEVFYVLVVPLHDLRAFRTFLGVVGGDRGPSETIGSRGDRFEVDMYGDLYVATPEPSLAVVANSRELLRRSLLNRARNLAHARNSDTMFEGVRRLMRERPFHSATTFVFWQPQDVPVVRAAVAAIRFGGSEIDLVADLDVVSGGVRVVDDLFESPPPPAPWTALLPFPTALAWTVEDRALSRYLQFLETFSEPGRFMREAYGGVLSEIRGVSGLNRLVLATTGYRSGVPDILMGIWCDAQELHERLLAVRRRLQEKRDRDLLTGMLATLPEGESPTSVADLVSAGHLTPEPWTPWNKYTFEGRRVLVKPLVNADFANDTFERLYHDWLIEYLTPRLTDNDIKYRPKLLAGQPAEDSASVALYAETLKSDRYRMVVAAKDGITWVATDVSQLEAVLERPGPSSLSLADSAIYQSASGQTSWRKVHGYANVDEWIHLGLLSPNSGANKDLQSALFDFQHHAALALNVSPTSRRDQMRLTVRVSREPRQAP
jgi:hypothetical protein